MTGALRRGYAAATGAATDHALRSTRSAAHPDAPANLEAEEQQDEQAEQVPPPSKLLQFVCSLHALQASNLNR